MSTNREVSGKESRSRQVPGLPKKGAVGSSTNKPAATSVNNRAKGTAPATSAAPAAARPNGAARGPQQGARSAQARTSGQMRPRAVPQKKTGFSLRPMDIALIVMGVLIVGAIIAGGLLTANNTGTTTGSLSGQPAGTDTSAPVGQPGQPAPDFSLPATDGTTYTLSQFVGKPVVIEFFAPWCPHCQEDAPMFNELYDTYNPKGAEFLAVSATPYGRNYQNDDKSPITMEDVTWFKDNFQVKFPMLFDGEVKSAADYNIEYYPTVYIIAKNGTIAEKLVGERDNLLTKERIAASIEKALK